MVGASIKVEVKNDKWKKLETKLQKELASQVILVGVPSGAKTPKTRTMGKDGKVRRRAAKINMATLAFIHEFGSPVNHIPRRPFMRQTLKKNHDEIVRRMGTVFSDIVRGNDVTKRMGRLGNRLRSLMQKEIASKDFKENAQITVSGGWMRNHVSGRPVRIVGKGSTTPLIDTGALRQSIIYKIAGPKEGNG